MELIGYLGAVIMGLSLGLIGGGGSILTVPILVYLFGLNPVLATAYSLFIVGLVSAIGGIGHMKMGNVKRDTALIFGIPSILSVYLTRALLVPAIPENIMQLSGFTLTKSAAMLILFAVLMLVAALSMIRKSTAPNKSKEIKHGIKYIIIMAEGLVVGMITGLVGAGGGFLIIPALVLLAKLPMKQAVGTSLVIIAAKSLLGFTGDLQNNTHLDWQFLLIFSSISVLGILAGSLFSKKISGEKLKPAFGYFVLVMGVYVLGRELFL